ncbi:MAG: thioredoxin family protein [Bacteriovoracaceae bacterium]|nr:thioredoxin family protein [Bacteriovoracaceae bacterium]
MAVKELNQGNYDSSMEGDHLKVIKFGADWCGPCKMIGPVLEKISGEFENVEIYDVNVDQNQDLSVKYAVRGIPAVYFVKNGNVVDSFVGARGEADIISMINKNI